MAGEKLNLVCDVSPIEIETTRLHERQRPIDVHGNRLVSLPGRTATDEV